MPAPLKTEGQIKGAAMRDAMIAEMNANHERCLSAPVTQTADGHHVGWRFPLSNTIYRTRELAAEFSKSDYPVEICCTRFARTDSIVRIPLTYAQFREEFLRELAA